MPGMSHARDPSDNLMITERSSGRWSVIGGRWSVIGGQRPATSYSLLAAGDCSLFSVSSGSIKPDAARLLHLPDSVVRARAAVGVDRRQRGRESACVLPAARSAPLRHGCADGGDGAGGAIGQDPDGVCAGDLPALSGLVAMLSTPAQALATASRTSEAPHRFEYVRIASHTRSALEARANACRPRPSCIEPQLTPLEKPLRESSFLNDVPAG